MRRTHWLILGSSLLTMPLAVHAMGCSNACEEGQTCPPADACDYLRTEKPELFDQYAAQYGCTDGGSGGGGGTPTGCVPSENMNPVEESCGVFVSTSLGDDMNGGTKDKPFKTIGAALGAANGKPVYACAETFEEAVVVSAPVDLYGGLDCMNGWAYVGVTTKTALTAPSDAIPLVVEVGGDGSRVEDLAVRAANAMMAGGSSIAVIVDGATMDVARCDFEAGSGAAGSDGDAPPAAMMKAEAGNPGKVACDNPVEVTGGPAKANPDCMDSVGGSGGLGVSAGDGDNGSNGSPSGAVNGGAGEVDMVCAAGTAGNPGMSGMLGAAGTELGSISATGYTGADGGNGDPGTIAQGGGGGGGAKGGNICTAALTAGAGASGGSGGPGGCGGLGGQGGKAGGASIALVTLDATVTLTEVKLTAAIGGKGGDGAAGQTGQQGGDGASGGDSSGFGGSNAGCRGGDGGKGGDGGQGGGGRGGHSFGIAHRGEAPVQDRVTVMHAPEGGPGGGGGNPGTAGDVGDVMSFP